MKILGIHDGHNATACLTNDGDVEFMIQEERFTGEKNFNGFPSRAIEEILRLAGMRLSDVDRVAVSSKHMPVPLTREQILARFKEYVSLKGTAKRVLKATPAKTIYRNRRRQTRMKHLLGLGIPKEKIAFHDHHLTHAATAYWGSPWRDDVLILTCDGSGDDLCATVNVGHRNEITRIAEVPESESIGIVYALMTLFLGMVPNEHEYKLMGMAPYAQSSTKGEAYRVFKGLFEFDAEGLTWKRKRPIPSAYYMFDYLKEKLEYDRFDRICAGLQYWVEEMLATWVKNCIRETGLKKVALSGGVFMNVKANKVIAELPEVDSLFIFPSCGDESNALGAAWVDYAEQCRKGGREPDIAPIGPIYWGHGYPKQDVENVLKRESSWLRYESSDDIEKQVAKLLANGEIVARFKGRMEFGARALGNRSILSDPSNTKQVKILNEMIKSRDFWMPFACSIMAERANDYVVNDANVSGPYMMMTYETTDQVEKIRAGTHPYDDTIRPQLVEKEWNPDYHKLISEFEKQTGIGAVLNTSFNLHGYPIVGTPEAAVDVLKNSGLKWLAIEDFLVEKTAG